MDDLESLADEIRNAGTVVALTGAGISAPSGVPTFRGDDGVWERFDEGQFAYGRFQRDPEGFWDDRVDLQQELFGGEFEPNAAHEALAAMGRDDSLEAILTQNTDGLHGDALESTAGSETDEVSREGDDPTVLELHGNARRVRCADCGKRAAGDPIFERAADGDLPPTCDCGGVYKPDVVLFGEQLPGAVIQRARSLARESDVFLAIGSSLVVQPAASLPRLAASAGATVGIINLETTPADDTADALVREDVTDALPRLQTLVTETETRG
ncbi:Sir2 family NAD-dependent protein deacetylase [Natronolimnohabitans sp. A-GB9]|uniref:SIR2 family NAD-dependent protein deacylase n=1 Tax=Natronolimnohabitans sp. A-GB9 TaxID=3069757 RepID=UPI0027B1B563|nr:Sir2 family NAD-dependent protein deacetylase [Natronolimnohabitans sp. A-GB9]MDQ2049436.1 Sir2 family NAD-dependent protein deacetylase [Natronolimnohabitans sp. A-GB9]